MERLSRTATAFALAVALSLAGSAGPAFAEEAGPETSPSTSADSAPAADRPPVPAPAGAAKPTESPKVTESRKPAESTEPAESRKPTGSARPGATSSSAEPSSRPHPTPTTDSAQSSSATPPETTPTAPAQPDLRLTVVLDRPSYGPEDLVVARATIVNAGTGAATGVNLTSVDNLSYHLWDGFTGGSVSLAPGESIESVTGAYVADVTGDAVRLAVEVTSAEPDANPADNAVTVTAPLTVVRGGFTGIAYGDRNWNHVPDPGEALAGLRVYASGGTPNGFVETVTDAEGRFAFHDLLAGSWQVYGDSPDWTFTGSPVEVDGTQEPEVAVRGQYDVTGWLSGSARFAAPTYAVGDTARMTITLANAGRGPLPGLTATSCSTSSNGTVATGELDPSGPGVTVPAGASRSVEVTVPVDAAAANAGYLEARCWIGSSEPYTGIQVTATTRIPGARAAKSVGILLTRLPSCSCRPLYRAVPDVTVYLRNQVTGAIVARAVTDANGYFAFFDVPADRYDLGLVGPWRGLGGSTPVFPVRGGDDGSGSAYTVVVEPGPDQPDPDAVPAPPAGGNGAVPAPPASAAGSAHPVLAQAHTLASTGTNVGWLALGGFATFLVGAALVLGTRRRSV
ncbi:LPXTG cell wall anchor domain-containing protein [Amycolatopsis mongoliensis]|uniref:LPXTG cell wall anchor domain-containing protein n=1 Tax=Amycolatopsis mongoliensis TaxID=715475 RepID=A0A9Y2JRR5_9PSEU|nr:LPXTG cell wall anchor domain-containing protein [Amycolatopsis sp. 4-36]WIY01759.1 LPXTG cell wall anchor domain-containing protein [Amycolatopsis sp. 4-36]